MANSGDLPRPLSAKFKCDFAYPTIKDRVPVILTKVIDYVYRMKADIIHTEGEAGLEDLKHICGGLSKLKNEIQTDKPLVALRDGLQDVDTWNQYLEHVRTLEGAEPSWFKSPWLYTECYCYRRIHEIIQLSSGMKSLDVFGAQKREAFTSSLLAVEGLAEYLLENMNRSQPTNLSDNTRNLFMQFLQISLWGNKCDLSISAGAKNHQVVNPVEQLNHLHEYMLADDKENLWQLLKSLHGKSPDSVRIDFILDNAGFELFSDLCLAEFLLSSELANKIVFHGKRIPWFVSDVTKEDFDWTLDQVTDADFTALQSLGKKWKKRVTDGTFVFTLHDYWTSPYHFAPMNRISPDLYKELAKSDLLIFKGDLNYRKLTGDLTWPTTTPFDTALQGFQPAPLCSLRTLKCDLVVGLAEGVAEETKAKDSNWMINGQWAVIQMSDKKS